MTKSQRRSLRAYKRDPIVAPGFGTQQDLQNLSNSLGLSIEAVSAVMESRGRGVRGRGGGENDATTTSSSNNNPTAMSTAWAEFLQDDPKPDKSTTKQEEEEEDTTKGATATTTTESPSDPPTSRVYQLPLTTWWNKTDKPPPTKKKKKSKRGGGGEQGGENDRNGGVLVQSGTLNATIIGRSKPSLNQPYDLVVPTILLPKVQIHRVVSSCNSAHCLALSTTTNAVYGWGRNEHGVLGSNLPLLVASPTILELPNNVSAVVVDAATGKHHTVLLDRNGVVYAMGSNKVGQCGIHNSTDAVGQFRKCVFRNEKDVAIVQVSCGEAFTVALSEDGHLYTTGSSEFGQLGNGETGEYFVTASKIAFANETAFVKRTVFCHAPNEKLHTSSGEKPLVVPMQQQPDIRIGYIACGKHHAIAVEAPDSSSSSSPQQRRVFTWGCGNYGCLGHGVQADEYRPRLVGILNAQKGVRPVRAVAGATCSTVLTENGHVYYWGKHRSVGESVMRPQLLAELAHNGHVVSHVGAGAQTLVCSTENAVTVGWGQGPHGELGLETKKSSAKPQFVPKLDKCRVLDLACGYGTTCWVLHNQDKDDKQALKQLPTITDQAIQLLESTAAANRG